jgi:hypothetical protein
MDIPADILAITQIENDIQTLCAMVSVPCPSWLIEWEKNNQIIVDFR